MQSGLHKAFPSALFISRDRSISLFHHIATSAILPTFISMIQRKFTAFFFAFATIFSYGQSRNIADYSDRFNWAVLPSDSIALRNEFVIDEPFKEVDVFYLYPTLLVSDKDSRWNYPIPDPKHRADVVDKVVKYQASAWAGAGNLYVPFYKQGHIRCYFNLEDGGRDSLLVAYSDVKAAFTYYLEHYNKGKGIVLAGHSQGSTHISLLLKDFFDGQPLQKQLIAAYIPGIGVEDTAFTTIPLMIHPEQTGGYVTWNTFKRRYHRGRYELWYKGKTSINPVTWDTTSVAPRALHEGFLFSNDKLYTQSFSTHLIDGGVWITIPKFPFRMMSVGMRNYHVGDVNLFWEDIRINVHQRCLEYLRIQPGLHSVQSSSDSPADAVREE